MMKKNSGMTLVELMIVICIIGILAATLGAIGVFSGGPNIKLKSSAYNLAGDLKIAKLYAVKNQTQVRLSFFLDGPATYRIEECGTDGVFDGLTDPIIKTVDLTLFRSAGIQFIAPSTFTGDSITFQPNGLANSTGFVLMINQDQDITYSVGVTSMAGVVVIRKCMKDCDPTNANDPNWVTL